MSETLKSTLDPDASQLLNHAAEAVAAMRRMDEEAAALFGGAMVAVIERELRRRLGKQSSVEIALHHGEIYMSDLHAQVMVEAEAAKR